MKPIYVRARDAAFYRNPVVVFPEGFLCFDEVEPPELVLWGELETIRSLSVTEVMVVLARRFGIDHGVTRVGPTRLAQRPMPGLEPPLFQPAAGFYLDLHRRIPKPKFHDGSERRLTRAGDHHAIDFPAHPRDAYELYVLAD